jgi:hypothetical protein
MSTKSHWFPAWLGSFERYQELLAFQQELNDPTSALGNQFSVEVIRTDGQRIEDVIAKNLIANGAAVRLRSNSPAHL